MSGYCTYTIYARVAETDGGGERSLPCGKERIGQVAGPGIYVVLCKRHYAVVERAVKAGAEYQLTLDRAEMAAGGDE